MQATPLPCHHTLLLVNRKKCQAEEGVLDRDSKLVFQMLCIRYTAMCMCSCTEPLALSSSSTSASERFESESDSIGDSSSDSSLNLVGALASHRGCVPVEGPAAARCDASSIAPGNPVVAAALRCLSAFVGATPWPLRLSSCPLLSDNNLSTLCPRLFLAVSLRSS